VQVNEIGRFLYKWLHFIVAEFGGLRCELCRPPAQVAQTDPFVLRILEKVPHGRVDGIGRFVRHFDTHVVSHPARRVDNQSNEAPFVVTTNFAMQCG
jgi:hypothetical protein